MANTETSVTQRIKVVMVGIYRWKQTDELQGNQIKSKSNLIIPVDRRQYTYSKRYSIGVVKLENAITLRRLR